VLASSLLSLELKTQGFALANLKISQLTSKTLAAFAVRKDKLQAIP
jgi:hypothetical protein